MMIREMQTNTINEILYMADPVGTCCNSNEGMEYEYWAVADDIVSHFMETNEFTVEVLRDTLLEIFNTPEEILDFDQLVEIADEITASIEA